MVLRSISGARRLTGKNHGCADPSSRVYRWLAKSARVLYHSQYELLNPLNAVTPFARLRVLRESGTPGRMSLEISVDIWLHSVMCDAIITAVVLMCKTNDPWLECAGVQLL